MSDALSMFSQGPTPDSKPYPHLLLKLGAAFLENTDTVGVGLTEEELWMIRETAKTSVTVGQEKVGLSLLRKVYTGLRQLTSEEQTHTAVLQVGETVEEEPKVDVKEKLTEWEKEK